MGIHNTCVPVCLVPLVHTGFTLGSFPILHTHPLNAVEAHICQLWRLSLLWLGTAGCQADSKSHGAGPAHEEDIDAFQFLSPMGL